MYLLKAGNTKTSAKVVSANWAYAYYLKAYSLLKLGRISEAKSLLERATALSPRNSQFPSEIGNIYQRERNWPKALESAGGHGALADKFPPKRWTGKEWVVESPHLKAVIFRKAHAVCESVSANRA